MDAKPFRYTPCAPSCLIMSEAGTGDADQGLSDFQPGPAQEQVRGSAEQSGTRIFGRQGTTLVIAASVALLAAACGFAGVLVWRDIQATAAVVDAREARRSGTLVFQAMLNAEDQQRGYLLMRDPAYLTSYHDAKAAFENSLDGLRRRLVDRPRRTSQIAAAARIGREKIAELDRTIALGEAGRFDDALAIVRSGAGKSLMDELSRIIDDLTTDANHEVEQATEVESWLSTSLFGAIIVALLCVAGLGAVLLKNARLHLALLEARETSARRLAEMLERRVARRTRELVAANQRFEAALRASGVTVMTQDRDLVFTWISRGIFGQPVDEIIGKPQQEVMPETGPAASTALRRGVIETGEPARGDIRVMHDGSETWHDLTVHPLKDEHGIITGIIAGDVDITRYKEQEARIRLLMRELTHRSKNLLTVIQAIMRQTASNSTSLEDFETRFSARLQSLAGSHDLLVREEWQGASMRELVQSQLGHYNDRAEKRIELSGESLQIGPDAAQHIGMALHELATNAAKYGALSTPEGKVRISWRMLPAFDRTPMCHLAWEESGGPPVERPSRRGFGRVVIERTVARALRGEVRIDYAASGLRWTLEFPMSLTTDS
jgi:PAS domain S-box-containing protein